MTGVNKVWAVVTCRGGDNDVATVKTLPEE